MRNYIKILFHHSLNGLLGREGSAVINLGGDQLIVKLYLNCLRLKVLWGVTEGIFGGLGYCERRKTGGQRWYS